MIKIVWACECGNEESRKSGEACKGTTNVYRVEPCPVCRRTMTLMSVPLVFGATAITPRGPKAGDVEDTRLT